MRLEENTNNKSTVKNITIIILILLLLLSITYIVFNKFNIGNIDTKATFIKDTLNIQDKLSYYLGVTYSDTFAAYTPEQIITGISEGETKIKDISNNDLLPLVDVKSKIEANGKKSYELNSEAVKKLLNIDLPSYDDIKWYVQDGEVLKVKFINNPSWWSSDLDSILVGK